MTYFYRNEDLTNLVELITKKNHIVLVVVKMISLFGQSYLMKKYNQKNVLIVDLFYGPLSF